MTADRFKALHTHLLLIIPPFMPWTKQLKISESNLNTLRLTLKFSRVKKCELINVTKTNNITVTIKT